MKLLFKVLKITAVMIIIVTAVLFSASLLMQDRVAGIILKSLNKNLATKYEFGSLHLSFLRKFPKASLDLKNVYVHSSPGFDRNCFAGINTDTLLSARSVSFEFSLTDIIRGIYNIDRIGVKEGHLKILTDTAGLVNYEIAVKSDKKTEEEITINLNGINVTDVKADYNNQATKLLMNGLIENGRLKSRIYGDKIDFIASSRMRIDLFRLYNTSITRSINADLDLNLHSSDSGVLFRHGTLHIENFDFNLKGFVSKDDFIDLELDGNNIDLSKIKNYLPDKYLAMASDYDPTGILKINARFEGPVTRTQNPLVEIFFSVNKGHIVYGKSDLDVNNISFSGFYSNGKRQNPETSSVSVRDLKAKIGSSEYSSALFISDFLKPHAELSLKGIINPSEIREFFNLKNISLAEGSVDVNLKVAGELPEKDKYTITDIFNLNPEGDLSFTGFGIKLKNGKFDLSQVTGKLKMAESIIAEDLNLSWKDHRIRLNGEFYNLPDRIAGKPAVMRADANVIMTRFVPEKLFPDWVSSASSSAGRKAFSLPRNIFLDLDFSVDSLHYKSFNAAKISGTLNYKPGLLNLKSLNLNSQSGSITGIGLLAQNSDKSLVARGSFNLENIDINKTFKTFNNFGQDFIKSENISGSLSGSLSILMPMDSLMKPKIKSLNAEGKYVILNGMLINFEPVMQLSSFIELSELETIRFERLENDFYISNNYLTIPQMDIKSSAADLTVNGKHSFNDDYEYHVKMLLSEILSRKIRKPRPNTSEFGVVRDDGLGRTSVLLKVEDRGDDVKVSYDLKAASNQLKNNIRAERENLKNILNQEYGRYKYDTAAARKQAGQKKFRITFDEIDTTKSATEPPVVKK